LRIIWASISLILVILALLAIRGFEPESSNLIIFSVKIPLGFENPRPYVVQMLSSMVHSIVPSIIVLGGFMPLGDWLTASGRTERFRGLLVGSMLAFFHGVLLSQLAMLPIFAISYRLLGNPFVISIILADINAMLLGLQLLLWTTAIGLTIKSNRGLAIFLAYILNEVGQVMTWCGEFLEGLEVNKLVVKFIDFIGKLLPSSQLPTDPIVWTTLLLSLGVPIVFASIVLLFPSSVKRSRN
jgi:hypothetical protein